MYDDYVRVRALDEIFILLTYYPCLLDFKLPKNDVDAEFRFVYALSKAGLTWEQAIEWGDRHYE